MATPGTATRVALLAGATGLIGHSLLPLLLADARYRAVHVLLRRAVPGIGPHPKLTLHTVDFARLQLSAAFFPAVDDVFIALGTTIKVAGSEAAFRQVDFDFVVNTARATRAAGATRLAVVSALGADAHSRGFYNRGKGDRQAAVGAMGYGSVVLAQPSLLVGDRAALGQPVRAGEVWATRLLGPFMGLVPKGVRPIQASAVAKAMLAASFEAVPGVRILGSARMQGSGQP
ncbi:MAG: NAD(P)H-binding protein [Rhizobacter sp.]|nr:NAD(P)H-binding protein [Rhizobacter sp.]